MNPDIKAFFDEATYTVSYVVSDPDSKQCAVIDPVLDYDAASGRTSTASADAMIDFVLSNGLQLERILDTHVHADHLSSAQYIKKKLGGRIGIGADVSLVQSAFVGVFNVHDVPTDGSHFDELLAAKATISLGSVNGYVMHTPGHTPACSSYVFGDACFVGDTLFMPDYGTARCDFPGGDAGTLFDSIQSLFALPDDTRLFMCHDYKAPGRDEFAWETTVAAERAENISIHAGITREEFIASRNSRDATLGTPKLLLPSIQVNIRAGKLPPAEENNISYIKIPLDTI